MKVCVKCHGELGFGLGVGKGQMYRKSGTNTWVKIPGECQDCRKESFELGTCLFCRKQFCEDCFKLPSCCWECYDAKDSGEYRRSLEVTELRPDSTPCETDYEECMEERAECRRARQKP